MSDIDARKESEKSRKSRILEHIFTPEEERIKELEAENAKLRDELFKATVKVIWEGQPPEPMGERCGICGEFIPGHKSDCILSEKEQAQ